MRKTRYRIVISLLVFVLVFTMPLKVSAEEELGRVMNYLSRTVTNPVVNTLGGEWSVLVMARYGALPESTKNNYLANLYRTLDERQGVLSKHKYTEYSRVVLALTSVGIHPSDVKGYNLLYPLAKFEKVEWQGINGPIWALIALDSHAYEIPQLTAEDLAAGSVQTTRELLVDTILEQQLSDGGWSLSGEQSDPDMTAMAILSLTPYCAVKKEVSRAVETALDCLSGMQTGTGGFASWDKENIESTAQTILALSALDVKLLSDARFVKNGKTVLDNLRTYQLENGAFQHGLEDNQADALATDQAAMALAAYRRATTGKHAFFDMTDVIIDVGTGGGTVDDDLILEGTGDSQEWLEGTQKPSGSTTSTGSRPKKTTKKEEGNVIKAEVKDNLVSRSQVAKIKGKDKNLHMSGTLSDGSEYTVILNGKDVKKVDQINIGLSRQSQYEPKIRQLAENPAILEFEQQGAFPGVMLVEVSVDKEDGEYLLLYYNRGEQKAEYVQKIEVKDKQTKFLVEKGGTYFVDKKASTKSLKETENEEPKEGFEAVESEELLLQGTQESGDTKVLYVLVAVCGLSASAGIGFALGYHKRKREDEQKNEK